MSKRTGEESVCLRISAPLPQTCHAFLSFGHSNTSGGIKSSWILAMTVASYCSKRSLSSTTSMIVLLSTCVPMCRLQGGASSFRYLSKSSAFTLPGVDDAEGLRQTLEAMRIVGMSLKECDAVFQTVACVLHLGNVVFTSNDNDEALPADESAWAAVQMVSTLMQVTNYPPPPHSIPHSRHPSPPEHIPPPHLQTSEENEECAFS